MRDVLHTFSKTTKAAFTRINIGTQNEKRFGSGILSEMEWAAHCVTSVPSKRHIVPWTRNSIPRFSKQILCRSANKSHMSHSLLEKSFFVDNWNGRITLASFVSQQTFVQKQAKKYVIGILRLL